MRTRIHGAWSVQRMRTLLPVAGAGCASSALHCRGGRPTRPVSSGCPSEAHGRQAISSWQWMHEPSPGNVAQKRSSLGTAAGNQQPEAHAPARPFTWRQGHHSQRFTPMSPPSSSPPSTNFESARSSASSTKLSWVLAPAGRARRRQGALLSAPLVAWQGVPCTAVAFAVPHCPSNSLTQREPQGDSGHAEVGGRAPEARRSAPHHKAPPECEADSQPHLAAQYHCDRLQAQEPAFSLRKEGCLRSAPPLGNRWPSRWRPGHSARPQRAGPPGSPAPGP